MPFGKFVGTKIRALLFNELMYMKWVLENTELTLDDEAFAKYEKLLEAQEGP